MAMKTWQRGIRMLKITAPQINLETCSRDFWNWGWNSKFGMDFWINPAFKGLTSMQMENIRTVLAEISNARQILHASFHELFHVINGVCAHYVMVIARNGRQNPHILIWLGPGRRTGRRRRGSVTCTETSPIQSQWRFRSDCLLPSEIGTSWCGRILHSMAFVLFCLYLSKIKRKKKS